LHKKVILFGVIVLRIKAIYVVLDVICSLIFAS